MILEPFSTDLTVYPERIARLRERANEAAVLAVDARQALETTELDFKDEAARHEDLTNETMRKAYIADRKANSGTWTDIQLNIAMHDSEARKIDVQLRYTLDCFRVAQLMYERDTAMINRDTP